MIRSIFSTLFAAALLSGCGSTPSQPADAQASVAERPTRCSSDAVSALIGKPASAALLEQARERAGAEMARQIGPDDIVTLDYQSQRLNLHVDQAGMVRSASCG